ncbi:hypothetical protein STEG23_003879, partial [Scotinomys teguina]
MNAKRHPSPLYHSIGPDMYSKGKRKLLCHFKYQSQASPLHCPHTKEPGLDSDDEWRAEIKILKKWFTIKQGIKPEKFTSNGFKADTSRSKTSCQVLNCHTLRAPAIWNSTALACRTINELTVATYGVMRFQEEVNELCQWWRGSENYQTGNGAVSCASNGENEDKERVSRTLAELGYERTPSQCRERIKTLRRCYSRVKEHGVGKRKSSYTFEQLEQVFGQGGWDAQPCQPVLINSSGLYQELESDGSTMEDYSQEDWGNHSQDLHGYPTDQELDEMPVSKRTLRMKPESSGEAQIVRETPISGVRTFYTDANKQGKAGYKSEDLSKVVQSPYNSVQKSELYAILLVLMDFSEPLNIVTDSQYAERVVLHIETAEFIPDESELTSLFIQLQDIIRNRKHPLYITHIRSHTGLPGPLAQGNDEIDKLLIGNVLEASEFHKKHHVNSKGLKRDFSITWQQAKEIVRKCPTCSFYNQTPLPAGCNPKGTQRNDIWQMDVFHFAEFGKLKYVHHTIDTYSGFQWATALSSEKADSVITHLLEVMAIMGIPAQIKTDNAPAYVSGKMKQFFAYYNIQHITEIKILKKWFTIKQGIKPEKFTSNGFKADTSRSKTSCQVLNCHTLRAPTIWNSTALACRTINELT